MMQKYVQCKKFYFFTIPYRFTTPNYISSDQNKSQITIYFSEIGKVRGNLFQINGKKNEPLVLPDAAGPSISLSEKVYVPIKEFPDVRLFMQYIRYHFKQLACTPLC